VSSRVRRLTSDNIEQCVPLVEERLLTSSSSLYATAACRRLLAQGSMMGILIDAVESGESRGVVGVGAGVFVSASFTQAERDSPRPGLSDRVLDAAARQSSVVFTRRDLDTANRADGLHLAVIFHYMRDGEPEPLKQEIRRQLMTSFVEDMRGYKLSEILVDSISEEDTTWAVTGGFRVRSTYPEWYRVNAHPLPRRSLVGITREEALAAEGTVMSMLFHYQPPTLAFTPPQRRLLNEAVQHKTDVEIAAALGVSLSAVKKTWAAVFDKAGHLLGSAPCEPRHNCRGVPTRGAQKRHTLLTYLVDHPEELRP